LGGGSGAELSNHASRAPLRSLLWACTKKCISFSSLANLMDQTNLQPLYGIAAWKVGHTDKAINGVLVWTGSHGGGKAACGCGYCMDLSRHTSSMDELTWEQLIGMRRNTV